MVHDLEVLEEVVTRPGSRVLIQKNQLVLELGIVHGVIHHHLQMSTRSTVQAPQDRADSEVIRHPMPCSLQPTQTDPARNQIAASSPALTAAVRNWGAA